MAEHQKNDRSPNPRKNKFIIDWVFGIRTIIDCMSLLETIIEGKWKTQTIVEGEWKTQTIKLKLSAINCTINQSIT